MTDTELVNHSQKEDFLKMGMISLAKLNSCPYMQGHNWKTSTVAENVIRKAEN